MSATVAGDPATRRERIGWYAYDWANSAFPTTVVTVFMGPYLTSIARAAADEAGFVYPLGIPVLAGSFYPYVLSLGALSQIALLPILGAICDYTNRRREFLAFFALLGALATTSLYVVVGDGYLVGGALFLLANVAFGASVVFYNAFLPEIAAPDERNRVSSTGWAFGYLGGGILLLLNLLLLSQAASLGLSRGDAARICLGSAGLWWGAFSLVSIARLRNRRSARVAAGGGYLTAGFRQLGQTLRHARRLPLTLLFLAAYLLYNDGIQAVIGLSSQFGQEELGLPIETLTQVILMVQFVAFFGALGFNKVADQLGAKRAIAISLVIWAGTVLYAYGFLRTGGQFFALGFVIALVLGGSQALSRSVFSHLVPKGREAEYFSLYEVGERGTSWLAPLTFGLALQMTGSYRLAILSVVVFLVAGLLLLLRVDLARAAREAGNDPGRV